ncbi:hypothetical protein PCASD_14965 [Puccinia coronata f. sp. avenae]|uniref:Integrase catalytic domain-containing protein n=1 Tax=Puccinia coronata f. sp. avenae TaxID=200324 RepID=A0A2N5U7D8_9BASI|nr:hypothetical protein PCASD_14965 [Puccinia coronata f. sp. avenae]
MLRCSSSRHIASSLPANEPPAPAMSLEKLDDVDDVTHANKNSRSTKQVTTDLAVPPNELAEFFKQPVLETPGYKWQPEARNTDNLTLLKSTRLNPLASTCLEIEHTDILAVDLIGPFQVNSMDGGKYFMKMRDVATGYCFVCVLTHKWEATAHIIAIIDKLETFTKLKVNTLRSNNGGEFVNNKLQAYLDGKGIVAECALPYHHYQNRVIEHFNWTVAAMARTILLDSTLPKSFWSFDFIWAAHTLNRIPNKASA